MKRHYYEEVESIDAEAIHRDWEAAGDQLAEVMVGAGALFGTPVPKEAIERVRQLRTRRRRFGATAVIETLNPFGHNSNKR